MEQTRKHISKQTEPGLIVCSLIGSGVGLVTMILCALLMPMLMLNTSDPKSLLPIAAALCAILGGAVGTVVNARLSGETSVVSALIGFAIMALPLVLVSLILSGERDLVMSALVLICLLASTAGTAFLMIKMSKSKKKSIKKLIKRR